MKRVVSSQLNKYADVDFDSARGMRLRDWLDANGLDISDIEINYMPYRLYQTRDLNANLNNTITSVHYDSRISPFITVSVKNTKLG